MLTRKQPSCFLEPLPRRERDLARRGRLRHSNLPVGEKHPIILAKDSPLTKLLIVYYHQKTHHQGRVITQAALRTAGYFIPKGSSTLKNFLKQCVTCQKLRGPRLEQIMSDLPPDRLECTPPFTHCGMDVFGPYLVTDGISTRRNNASKKCWALLITVLCHGQSMLRPFLRWTSMHSKTRFGDSIVSEENVLQFDAIVVRTLSERSTRVRKTPSTCLNGNFLLKTSNGPSIPLRPLTLEAYLSEK